MNMHHKRVIILFIIGIGIVLATFVIMGMNSSLGDQIKAVKSLRQLDNELYEITYKGDDGVDALIAQGGVRSDEEMAQFITHFLSHGVLPITEPKIRQGDFGCSTLVAPLSDADGYLFGRNFDWQKKGKTLIVKTTPTHGYASVATACIDFLGIDLPEPSKGHWMRLLPYIGSLFMVVDGINEKGLCVADLFAGDHEKTCQERGNMAVTTTVAIRLLLDKAATTDEAIQWLSNWDMHSSIDWAHHLAISDATGHAVVVEYVDNQMIVTETPAVTNHYITSLRPAIGIGATWARRDTLCARLETYPTMCEAHMLQLMQDVSFEDYTGWTVLFNTADLSATYYYRTVYNLPRRYIVEK